MVFNALFIVGLHLSTGNDMLLEKPARWIDKRIPYWWTKPLFNCPTCMASVHSILPYWYLHDFNTESMVMYILYVPSLSALATYFTSKIVEE